MSQAEFQDFRTSGFRDFKSYSLGHVTCLIEALIGHAVLEMFRYIHTCI